MKMKYIGDYDTLRPFIRYIAYGCYHKDYLMKKIGQSSRNYDDNWARLRFFLPPDKISTTRHGHREIHTLNGDIYQHNDNYLAKTFQIKALKPKSAFYLLCLLQIFTVTKKPLDETTLLQYKLTPADRPRPSGIKDISRSTIKRYLTDLVHLGLVNRKIIAGRYHYQKKDNILTKLTSQEIMQLLTAVNFYTHLFPISLPGIYLEERLSRMLATPPPKSHAQIKHSPIDRLIDNELLHSLNYCIQHSLTAEFSYRQKEISVIPLHIDIDQYDQPQYLQAITKTSPSAKHYRVLQTFRIDLIQNLRHGKTAPTEKHASLSPTAHKLCFSFQTDYDRERETIQHRILQRFPQAAFKYSKNHPLLLHCILTIHDDLSLLPWLRTFYPTLCPHTISSPILRTRLIDDLKEALDNYGICAPVS